MFKIVTLKEKKISKIKRPKIKKKNCQEEKLPENFKVPKSVIQKLNEEFLQELRNEIRNQPDFSSVTLSNYLRGTSRSRNVLFQENILCSTLEQNVQSVLKLTPEILTIHSKNRTKNVILEEIQLLQIDEFYQICTIYALTRPLVLEKFPENGMANFLL